LKIHNVPSDGLCFIHCIRLYFKQILNIDYSVVHCRHLYEKLFETSNELRSSILSIVSIDSSEIDPITKGMEKYFDKRIYNDSFTDTLINLASLAFNVTITIIEAHMNQNNNFIIGNIIEQHTTYDTQFESNLITVLRLIDSDGNNNEYVHYQLLLPFDINLQYKFISNDLLVIDNSSIIIDKSSQIDTVLSSAIISKVKKKKRKTYLTELRQNQQDANCKI
jgi:hypothetical protein